MIRRAQVKDADDVLALARKFATSFAVDEMAFRASFGESMDDLNAYLAVAEIGNHAIGYLLAFCHRTFYANGPVAWIEELMVEEEWRGRGIGRALMKSAEEWAAQRDCRLMALATRRAAEFYRAIDYEESAVYFRKLL